MTSKILFPPQWIDASAFEKTVRKFGDPHTNNGSDVWFSFPTGCKIMIDSAVRLLSFVNQLDHTTRRVFLEFEEGEYGTMSYLNRMGFFNNLEENIEVLPARPPISTAEIYEGQNSGLVEIARINYKQKDDNLPSRLTEALINSCGHREDANELQGAAWTIFAELIDNIFSHSKTPLDGYAALQLYSGGKNLIVAVSDSGLGIMETLRPVLTTEYPSLTKLSDIDLLVEIFRLGISRHGTDRGCGLKGSAAKAIKYNADLDIRLPNNRVVLTPAHQGYRPNMAFCYENLPLIWGTQICFKFHLD